MERQATWRALAATYAVVATMQVYLAVSMEAVWAWALATACAIATISFWSAAWRARRRPASIELPEPASPGAVLADETRNAIHSRADLRSRY